MPICDCQICSELKWPEPLVIDLIVEHLEQYPLTVTTRQALARRHAAVLRDMVADASWHSARRELGDCYTALSIATTRIAVIDHAVVYELSRLAAVRTRNSPRRRREVAGLLQAAVARLSTVGAPGSQPLAA